jgi:hypothetical protein
MQHAAYPHTPGMLYDCELCESTCFCGPDGEDPCVFHALIQESEDLAAHYDWDAWYSQDS